MSLALSAPTTAAPAQVPTLRWNVVRSDGAGTPRLRAEPADQVTRDVVATPSVGARATKLADGVVLLATHAAEQVGRPLPDLTSMTFASTWQDFARVARPHDRGHQATYMEGITAKALTEAGRVGVSPVYAGVIAEHLSGGSVTDAAAGADLLVALRHEIDHVISPIALAPDGKRPSALFGASTEQDAITMFEARAELSAFSPAEAATTAQLTGLPFDASAFDAVRTRPHYYDMYTKPLANVLTHAGLDPYGIEARQLLHASPIESPPSPTKTTIARRVLETHDRPVTPKQMRRAEIFVNRHLAGHDVPLAEVLPTLDTVG